MPIRPPRICPCGHRIASGTRCPCERKRAAEEKAKIDKGRPSARARGYDRAWQELRARFLAAYPMCSHPLCRAPATEVDHIESIRDRPDLRLAWGNLRPLCKSHHSQRTAREQAFGRDRRGVVDDLGGAKGPGGCSVLRERAQFSNPTNRKSR